MFKIQDIEKYINDPILETIFRGREEELYNEDENRDIIKIKEEYPVCFLFWLFFLLLLSTFKPVECDSGFLLPYSLYKLNTIK